MSHPEYQDPLSLLLNQAFGFDNRLANLLFTDLTPNIISSVNKNEEGINSLLSLYKADDELLSSDLWQGVSARLDEVYKHSIVWTRDQLFINHSSQEKYLIGLNEYIDLRTSAEQTSLISNHLLECQDCRQNYLSLSKQKDILKYAFVNNIEALGDIDLWSNISRTLFFEEESKKQA